MLKNIDPRLHPDLLHVLARMGHGDRIAIVDRNYPAESTSQRLVRLDGQNLVEALDAVLSVFPLDQFVEAPLAGMNQDDDPLAVPEAQAEAFALANDVEGREISVERIARHDFYDVVRGCFAVLATSESRPYGCIILTKGVV